VVVVRCWSGRERPGAMVGGDGPEPSAIGRPGMASNLGNMTNPAERKLGVERIL